jgi:hypothetical protein
MKYFLSLFFIVFILFFGKAQEHFLIEETDSIQLFETYLSNTSTNNVFPSFYKNGLLYVSNFESKGFKLFYSDLFSITEKVGIGSKFNFGSVSVFENEIYFTGTTNTYNSAIYQGVFEDFKVKKLTKLDFCNPGFTYSDPFISENGEQMVLVSSEKNVLHIVELVKNEANEWVVKSVPYISHPAFEIMNPTLYNENTIYFSSNMNDGKVTGVIYNTTSEGKIIVSEIKREQGDFNIYKIERNGKNWGIPIKVIELNSEFDELGVLFDSDKSGYLTSRRYNSNDNIYYFILKH